MGIECDWMQDDAPEAKGSFAMKAVSALAAAQLALLPFAGAWAWAFDNDKWTMS